MFKQFKIRKCIFVWQPDAFCIAISPALVHFAHAGEGVRWVFRAGLRSVYILYITPTMYTRPLKYIYYISHPQYIPAHLPLTLLTSFVIIIVHTTQPG